MFSTSKTRCYCVSQTKLSFHPQQKALDEAFISQINATGEQTVYCPRSKKDPWLDYAMKNRLEGQITIALNNMPAWFTSPQLL